MPQTYEQTLDLWVAAHKEAKAASRRELELRQQLFAAGVKNPKEGTNKVDLVDGRQAVFNHKINRSVDEAVVGAVYEELRSQNDTDAAPENFFKVKHELVVGAYKKADGLVKQTLTKCVTEKPGTPSLEVR